MRTTSCLAVSGLCCLLLSACGGGGSSGTPTGAGGASASPGASPTTAVATQRTVPLLLSDAYARNWANVAVKVLSVALVPTGGGAPVPIYQAPANAPSINLEQLDQIGALIGSVTVPVGQYQGALVSLAGNPGDVQLISSADPDPGFQQSPGSPVAPSQIQIQGAAGATGSQTVPLTVPFDAPYVVPRSGPAHALKLDFQLSRPAAILAHVPANSDPTLWAVDFQGPLQAYAIGDITSLVLQELYGSVASVSADGHALLLAQLFAAEPVANPETAIPAGQTLSLLADGANGTLVQDLDAHTSLPVSNYAGLAALTAGRYVRVQARYQSDGSLVAAELWVGDSFQEVWDSPEGHVLHVNPQAGTLTIDDDSGSAVTVPVTATTQFDYRGVPIGTGTAFLSSGQIVRGFKVHVAWDDPNAARPQAQQVDIETASFSGTIAASGITGFTYESQFTPASDNYTRALNFIAATTSNGSTAQGQPISGYDYWNFAYPSEIAYGSSATSDFQLATTGPITASGQSVAIWNDPASPENWAIASTELMPVPLGLGKVASGLVDNGVISTFGLLTSGSTTPLTIELITATGSAPLVYQVDRTHQKLTLTAVDITSASGLQQLSQALAVGASVRVYGIPKSDGTLQAYTVLYYTGEQPRDGAAPGNGGQQGNGQGKQGD